MSGRELRAAIVAVGALVLLSGCNLGTHQVSATSAPVSASAPPPVGSVEHPRPVECSDGLNYATDETSPPTPTGDTITLTPTTATTPTAPPGKATPTGTATPSGKAATPTGSPSGRTSPSPSTTPPSNDVTIGPLTWLHLGAMATGDQTAFGTHNSDGWHYRVRPDIRSGATVTVTVGAEQRAAAGLEYGGGFGTTPTPAVTFHSCPGANTTFPGGFFITGNGRACVPLEVRIGDARPQRIVISFFNGDCPA